MALLEVLRELAGPMKLTIRVAHVHHMLRPGEADADRTFVRRYAGFTGLPWTTVRVDVPSRRRSRSESLEEAARALRYEALERLRVRTGMDVIATGHHADDQIETVLMRTLRGSEVRGAAGILPALRVPPVIRPLLAMTKREIMAYLDERRIPYREDSSNADVRLTRNAVRRHLIPQLVRHGEMPLLSALPAYAEVSRRFGTLLREVFLGHAHERIRTGAGNLLVPIATLTSLPTGLRRTFVAMCMSEMGIELTTDRILRVLGLVPMAPGKRIVFRSSDVQVFRDRQHLAFRRGLDGPKGDAILRPGSSAQFGPSEIVASRPGPVPQHFPADRNVAWVDASKVTGSFRIRVWRPGDRIRPLGMGGRTKNESDILQDARVPLYYKDAVPVVTHRGTIIWVCGVRPDERYKITPDTRLAIQLSYHTSV